jgi:WD repeat-containing protein 35
MMAIMEKTRMYVLSGGETEEPVVNSGYICSFKNLTVRTALIDEFVKDPQNPSKSFIVDIEIKVI